MSLSVISYSVMLTFDDVFFSIVFQAMQSYSARDLLGLDTRVLLMPVLRNRYAFHDCPLLLHAASKCTASPVQGL